MIQGYHWINWVPYRVDRIVVAMRHSSIYSVWARRIRSMELRKTYKCSSNAMKSVRWNWRNSKRKIAMRKRGAWTWTCDEKEFELKLLSFPVVIVTFAVFWSSFYKCLINYWSPTICKFLFRALRTRSNPSVWLLVARFRIWVSKHWTISMLVCSIRTSQCSPTISFLNFCRYLWSSSIESNVHAVEQWNVCRRTFFVLQPCVSSVSSRTDTLCRDRLCCGALLAHCQSHTHSFSKCLLSAAWRTNEDRWKWFGRGRRATTGTNSNE